MINNNKLTIENKEKIISELKKVINVKENNDKISIEYKNKLEQK